jgi:hypothetical protein
MGEKNMMPFSRAEKGLILDVLNGTVLDEAAADLSLTDAFTGRQIRPGLGGQIAHECLEAIEGEGVAEKWGVDGAHLIAKLESLTKEEGLNLARAVRAWWDRVGNGEQPDFDELTW